MYTQEEINYGQRRINYELCEVDLKIIDALNAIVEALKAAGAAPPSSPGLKRMDVNKIEKAISEAAEISGKVADIKPPGCEPAPYPN